MEKEKSDIIPLNSPESPHIMKHPEGDFIVLISTTVIPVHEDDDWRSAVNHPGIVAFMRDDSYGRPVIRHVQIPSFTLQGNTEEELVASYAKALRQTLGSAVITAGCTPKSTQQS